MQRTEGGGFRVGNRLLQFSVLSRRGDAHRISQTGQISSRVPLDSSTITPPAACVFAPAIETIASSTARLSAAGGAGGGTLPLRLNSKGGILGE